LLGERYHDRPREPDDLIRREGPFVAHSSRTLFDAVKP
jgi:hypothetical protein